MRNKHRNLLSAALVMLCIALLAGTAVLLLRTLPKKQPGTVETIQTGAVFDQTDNTAAPDREQAYDGELPNLSDTLEPDEAETPAPEDEAALAAAKLADQTLASMTLDEKLWQLFFVTPEAITKVETATLAGEATKAAIESQPVGGLVYFAKNLENRAQTVTLLENSQSYSKIPLFLGVDEEGGTVSRLKTSGLAIDTGVGTMQSIGETADPAAAYAAGQEIAGNLHALGFNLDFAPVTDVSSGKNAAIGSRSFGTDPELCASMAGIISNALTDGGVIPCLKHFPGYGGAAADGLALAPGADHHLQPGCVCQHQGGAVFYGKFLGFIAMIVVIHAAVGHGAVYIQHKQLNVFHFTRPHTRWGSGRCRGCRCSEWLRAWHG